MDNLGWLSRLSAVGFCPPPTTGVELVASILVLVSHPGIDTEERKTNYLKTIFLHSLIVFLISHLIKRQKKCYEIKFLTKWRLFLFFQSLSPLFYYNLLETKVCLIDLSSASENSRLLQGCHSAFCDAKLASVFDLISDWKKLELAWFSFLIF